MRRGDHGLRLLRIPPQSTPAADAFDARPRRVAEWVRELPMANVGETARRLYGALSEMNAQTLRPSRRLRTLELIREPASELEHMLERHYLHHRLPLPARRRKAADLARALPAKLATGYKATARDLADAGTRAGHRHMVLAVHRALSYLGQVLLRAYQAYVPVPPGVWLEIHTLYAFAERHGLLDRRVKDPLAPNHRGTTIGEIYKQILLLDLASPYRLHQGEVGLVAAGLGKWARHARLDTESTAAGDARFMVTLDADAPPGDPDQHAAERPGERRVLQTEGLLRLLRRELDRDPLHWWSPRRAEPELDPELMRRLVHAWGRSPRRRFSRTTRSTRIRAAIGLSAIHHLLDHSEASRITHQTHVGYRSHYASVPTHGYYGRVPDVWDMTMRAPQAWPEANGPMPELDPNERQWPYMPEHVRLLNISPGGHCLLWDNDRPDKARVGELVWIPESQIRGPGQSGVGVVRWMKSVRGRGLELGVQLLAPTARAAVARPAPEDAPPGSHTPVLLLPAIRGIDQARTMVLPTVPYRTGDRIAVIRDGRQRHYRLRRLVEDSGGFRRFEVESLEPARSRHSRTATQRAEADREFATAWASL